MNEEQIHRTSEYIVDEIIKDICGRSGIGDEFENIDEDIRQEIVDTWKQIVKDNLK